MMIEQLRELTALQAEDDALWAHAESVHMAYIQQGLQYLTNAIEGESTFEQAKAAIQDMMP
jgi:hypothetical protein